MTDFTPPFADEAEKRVPTSDERTNGFPCGPASQSLFNGLFWLLESQIKDVADAAGQVPSQDFDSTLLLRAINALISAATGGSPAGYILMDQARARLPIFPEVLNVDGRIGVTAPATGTIRVPGGVTFQHRGIYQYTTAQTDFMTDPSKTYHLRCDLTTGTFSMNDLSAGSYNPSVLAETNIAFDSDYDDMLVSRIITNGSNVASITNLANMPLLKESAIINGTDVQLGSANGANYAFTHSLNWARTPLASLSFIKGRFDLAAGTDLDFNIMAAGVTRTDATSVTNASPIVPIDRYRLNAVAMRDYAQQLVLNLHARA